MGGHNTHHNMLSSHNDFDENLLMDDLDIDELLECDDIEQTAFISSSKQLLSMLDNVISSIDDRINIKRSNYYGGYFAGNNAYNVDEYGPSN